jgi:hypothetical protein
MQADPKAKTRGSPMLSVTADLYASYFGIVPSGAPSSLETAHVQPTFNSATGSAAPRLSSNQRRA